MAQAGKGRHGRSETGEASGPGAAGTAWRGGSGRSWVRCERAPARGQDGVPAGERKTSDRPPRSAQLFTVEGAPPSNQFGLA